MDNLVASPFLSLRLDPPTARPSQDALIRALQECTRFRLHAAEDSTPQIPHFSSVEFENIGLAHKAFATVRNQQLSLGNDTACTLSLYPHNASPGSAPPSPPKDARPLNVSELPPHYTPAQVYDRFISYGPIFSCEMPILRGSCRLTFCDPTHATRAQEEMNFSALETYQIIVRFPSKYDAKDSFKAAGLGLDVKSGHPQQRQRRVVSESRPVSAATATGPAAGAGDRRASAGGHHPTVSRTAIFASSINGIIQQARGPLSQTSPSSRTDATSDGTSHTDADASADVSATTAMRSPAAPKKNATGPVKISDPVRLIVQNLPSSMDAPGLYRLFAGYGSLAEASLASHRATGARLGIGLLRYATPEDATCALTAMNGRFVEGHRASQPLYIKLWELKGELESDLRPDEGRVHCAEVGGAAAPSQTQPAASTVPASQLSDMGELGGKAQADRREASFASTSSASAATADTTTISNVSSAPSSPAAEQLLPSNGKTDSVEHADTDREPSASAIPPELRRHHKLLLLSLRDDLREPREQAEKLADLLVRLLPESERKKCILDEEYLRERVRKAREAFGVSEPGSQGHASIEPERVVHDRAALLQLYSPTSFEKLALDEMAAGVSAAPSAAASKSRSVSPTARKSLLPPPMSPGHERAMVEIEGEDPWATPAVHQQPRTPRSSSSNPTASVSLETLVRFSARGIIDLAASAAPPALLSSRPPDKVLSVDAFLETIKGLKPSQQKQRVGERIFKLFKGAPGPPMKNISKRTVALLDQEDIAALAHLAEEFPDILVAKATAMQV